MTAVNPYADLTDDEIRFKFQMAQDAREMKMAAARGEFEKWAAYQSDPVAFVEEVLEETLWSKQREILVSVRDSKRTAVPACHAPGKTHLAARLAAWWVSIWPPGTAQVLTTAPKFRQVRNILWPHIRRLRTRHGLPGETIQTEWKIEDEIVAYGFSAADTDEDAVQGVHYPHLLVIVDEAGGISATLGRAFESLLTDTDARILAIGNPPTDEEHTWFERICESDLWNVIRIPAAETPNWTGEDAGTCRACPPSVPEHAVATHLVEQEWAGEVVEEFGADSAFVTARVQAQFPEHVANKTIPIGWLEDARANRTPDDGLDVRLGVDVAADGGDEFVIAKAVGWTVELVHFSSGSENANSVDVAGRVLREIEAAETAQGGPVRVKVDSIGVGWGVVSELRKWGEEGRHSSTVVAVNVAESASDPDRFKNQRAEMWWNGRELLKPRPDESQTVALSSSVDRRTLAQLSGPTYRSDSSGRIQIESKGEMKRRKVPSPDRAEAILLALYEPPGGREIEPSVASGFERSEPPIAVGRTAFDQRPPGS